MRFPKTLSLAVQGCAAFLLVVLSIAAVCVPAHAQSFTVLHTFTGGGDGAQPQSGVTLDRAGNLYFTTLGGNGTVGKLSHRGSGWTLVTLHTFTGGADGQFPLARVVFGPDGKLYGTTQYGGAFNWGTLFTLTPPASVCGSVSCPWDERIIHDFGPQGSDGTQPNYGDIIFDAAGSLYGATLTGGHYGGGDCGEPGCGAVYQVTPVNGGWSESVIYSFMPSSFFFPASGVTFDSAGNLLGTATSGAKGAIYALTPHNGSWSEATVYDFPNPSDGAFPRAGLTPDGAGNFFGATSGSASLEYPSTVFELSPPENFQVIYTFSFINDFWNGPQANLTLDPAGNIYGTTGSGGAFGHGNVFKLTRSNGGWTYSSLHDFTGGSDGSSPLSSVSIDGSGNLYGTTSDGGLVTGSCPDGCGVVWEITR